MSYQIEESHFSQEFNYASPGNMHQKGGYSMSQLCSIHHDIPVTLHIRGAYGQWSVFDHNGDKQSGGPRD